MFDGPIRGGTRGGQGEFKWSDVSADKDRENYLGHSINAPTGRWQKNKDVHWYNRDLKDGEAERLAEIRRIKEAEEDALAVALGFKPTVRQVEGKEGPGEGAGGGEGTQKSEDPTEDVKMLKESKEERRRRKEERRRLKEEKRARKDARRVRRHADSDEEGSVRRRLYSRSRSRSPQRPASLPRSRSPGYGARGDRRRRTPDYDEGERRRRAAYDEGQRERERERHRERWDESTSRRHRLG